MAVPSTMIDPPAPYNWTYMEVDTRKFIDDLGEIWPTAREIAQAHYAEWGREKPLTTILLGEVGGDLFAVYDEMDPALRSRILALLETACATGSDDLQTVACTGMLEAIANQSHKDPDRWDRILLALGPTAQRSALAWDAWCGVENAVTRAKA